MLKSYTKKGISPLWFSSPKSITLIWLWENTGKPKLKSILQNIWAVVFKSVKVMKNMHPDYDALDVGNKIGIIWTESSWQILNIKIL